MGPIQTTTANDSSSVITLTLNGVLSNSTLVLLVFCTPQSAVTTPAGFTIGNAPTLISNTGTFLNSLIYYNQAPSVNNTVTVSIPSGHGKGCLMEWGNFLPSALDVAPPAVNANNSGTAGNTSISSGPLQQSREVIFIVMGENTTGSGTSNLSSAFTRPPSGYTDIFSDNDSLNSYIWDMCYTITSSNTSNTASWTWVDTPIIMSQVTMASFKLANITSPITMSLSSNGQIQSNRWIEGLAGPFASRQYSNGTVYINRLIESNKQIKLFANGTMQANSFAELTSIAG